MAKCYERRSNSQAKWSLMISRMLVRHTGHIAIATRCIAVSIVCLCICYRHNVRMVVDSNQGLQSTVPCFYVFCGGQVVLKEFGHVPHCWVEHGWTMDDVVSTSSSWACNGPIDYVLSKYWTTGCPTAGIVARMISRAAGTSAVGT